MVSAPSSPVQPSMPETAFPPPPDKGYTRCANSDLVIEDDEPADSILSKKLQRLLTSALYASFQPKAEDTGELIPFLATANIGLFSALKLPPLMPDVTLSLEVAPPASFERKEDRTYLVWEMGKPPDVVIEIVSKRKGEELGRKRKDYARAGVSYYAVYDRTAGVASPLRQLRELQGSPLALFQRRGGEFVPFASTWLEDKGLRPANAKRLRPANAKRLRPANAIGLGLTLWQRSFEVVNTEWLRWPNGYAGVIGRGRFCPPAKKRLLWNNSALRQNANGPKPFWSCWVPTAKDSVPLTRSHRRQPEKSRP
ncbi:Uma2 family endonuclease [Synechococcus sp. R5-16]|uniref:Uma2 family endonuclease n=3 Tax=Synechococcus TaxID=1129 RepID=UPI0039C35EB5